jgi:hypothetical protein
MNMEYVFRFSLHFLSEIFLILRGIKRDVIINVYQSSYKYWLFVSDFNPLTPELNPSAQRCMTRFFTGDFATWTVHFVNICVKNQQIHQLFIQFINYVWCLLHVSALHCHLQGAFLVPSERCSIEEQSIQYCGWVCCV